ncbi:MAG: hypothetical protein V4850_07825 [Myxococcota bacterium]
MASKKDDRYKELRGGHVAADEDADRAVPADRPPDMSGPYVPHIPGFSPGISHGDDLGDMGGRSGVNASANAGAPGAPESEPRETYEPAHPPVGRGVGEGDRGVAGGGGLTATPGQPAGEKGRKRR